MNILKDIVNLTTTSKTSTSPDGSQTASTQPTNDNYLRHILNYALPSFCLAMLLIVFLGFGIRHRQRILSRWNPLRKMRNTNPKFHRDIGLRRDSEYESYNHEHVKSTLTNIENSSDKEREYHLSTIN